MSPLKKLWTNCVTGYVAFSFRRRWWVLVCFLSFAIVMGIISAKMIRVVTNLEVLLPSDATSVTALNESKRRIGSTDFFVVAIRSTHKNIHHIASMQDSLKHAIETEWKDAGWVQIARDTDFFKKHALYYLHTEKLHQLADILEEETIHRSADIMPGFVDLLADSDPQEMPLKEKLSNWLTASDLHTLGMPPQIENELIGLFENDTIEEKNANTAGAHPKPQSLKNRLIGPASDVGVVMVQLTSPSTDLNYAQFALARGTRLIGRIQNQLRYSDIEAQVVGAYRSFKEVDSVSRDGITATTISVIAVLVMLIFFFKTFRHVFIIFFPLLLAGTFTMGITALVYGRLTVLTIFVLAMLAGMGIDYGIHLIGNIDRERRLSASLMEACVNAMVKTGPALMAACVTTVISLLVLQLGHFNGFKEFGVVASLGLLLCLFFTLLAVPPCCAVFLAKNGAKRNRLKKIHLKVFERINASRVNIDSPVRTVMRMPGVLFFPAVAIILILVPRLSQVSFENDFRNLRGSGTGSTIGYGRAIGKNASTTPSIILGSSRTQMAQVHNHLISDLHDPMLNSFITLRTFVPAMKEQRERQKIIRKIHQLLIQKAFSRLKKEEAAYRDLLIEMTDTTPFTAEALPQWARRIVSEKNGTVGAIGHLYANVKDWDAQSVIAFQQKYQQISVPSGHVAVANSAFILADIVQMVKTDGGTFLVWVSIAIALILVIYSQRLTVAIMLMITIGLSGIATAEAITLFNLKIGLYNIVVIPVILGVGIDSAIHLYHTHRQQRQPQLAKTILASGKLITASSWTTVCGFTGLLFVEHKGLQTIGQLACIGVGVTWLTTMLILPFLLKQISRVNP